MMLLAACYPTPIGWPISCANMVGRANNDVGRVSADGEWIARDGGDAPRWRGDGRALFCRAPGSKVMSVEVKTDGGRFAAGLKR
jgi:hypothetical protein